MSINLGLPAPDGAVLLGAVVFVGVLGLSAVWVWRRDRRAARRRATERDAVPRPVSEDDMTPCHRLPDDGPHSPSGTSRGLQAAGANLRCQGTEDNGALAMRLRRTVAEVARVLPSHSFRVEVLLECREISVEEPAFSLALAALLLHAAQRGRLLFIELAPLAPEHPMYHRSASPQLIVHVTLDPEQPGPPSYLADRAIDTCRLAGGAGSVEADSNLWLIWPMRRHAVGSSVQASASAAQTSAPCA
ncbi:MAG: hypothetical protein U1A78_16030 [Polyangia bacterium]